MQAAYYTLEAICPSTGKIKTVKLMDDDFQAIYKYGPRYKFYSLCGDKMTYTGSSVQEVLLSPTAIFGGVREHQKGGVCYVGVPSRGWLNSGTSVPPPPGMVFLVFVSPKGHLYEWRWERTDPDDAELPIGYQDRFPGGRIWPRN